MLHYSYRAGKALQAAMARTGLPPECPHAPVNANATRRSRARLRGRRLFGACGVDRECGEDGMDDLRCV